MENTYFAHSHPELHREQWQTLERHLKNVASMAAEFASVFGGEEWAEAAGKLHDVGKCKPAFQEYLLRTAMEVLYGPSGIDHSSVGACLAVQRSPQWGKILAYALAGHHAGLPDARNIGGATLEARLGKEISDCAKELDTSLDTKMPHALPFSIDPKRFSFQISFFIRMIFSCLVDADFLDTEKFMDPERHGQRYDFPTIADLNKRFFPALNKMVKKAPDTTVNRIRRVVLDDCMTATHSRPGFFSLSVPTGGGKTLSSLSFALEHARIFSHSRVIYVIPYMSIIEQNAAVFREFVGQDAVLEHHSSFDFDAPEDKEGLCLKRAKLAAENWNAPLVATTAVQFFESLFAAKPGRCRKLHNIAGSVIILDEAQMLPQSLLIPCLEALKELVANYSATIVLCTATQPALSQRNDFRHGLENVCEIVNNPEALHNKLKRVQVEKLGQTQDNELVDKLATYHQVLCITNTRGHARKIYELLSQAKKDVYHLSANMCPAHRSLVLQKIRHALKNSLPCLVVSTQLVEAGVDVDFPVVYRASSGVDSIAQAAGRCDREGVLTQKLGRPGGRVYVFIPENGLPPGHFRVSADTAQEVMRHYSDILSPQSVEMYFRHFFWKAGSKLDEKEIMQKLGSNAKRGNFPFREVAGLFQLIEKNQHSVIIPWDQNAENLISSLAYVNSPGGLLRRLQPYTVQVYEKIFNQLVLDGAVELVGERFPVLRNMDIYSGELGLCSDNPLYREAENMIV